MRKIRQSLLFVTDGTPISYAPGDKPKLAPSTNVCVEIGYALHCKHPEQLLIVQQERTDIPGTFPFVLPSHNRLLFQTKAELHKSFLTAIAQQIKPFNLF